MKKLIMYLFLSTHKMNPQDLFTQVSREYSTFFNNKERENILNGKCSHKEHFAEYSKENLKYTESYKTRPFFPSVIGAHELLRESTHRVFSIHSVNSFSSTWKDQAKYLEKQIAYAYLDIVQLYWLGYLAFLSELAGESRFFESFVNKYKTLPLYDFRDSYHLIKYTGYGFRLTKENCEQFLKSFIVHYALGTCFSSMEIDTSTRIKSLRLWKTYDPRYELYFFKGCEYDGNYNSKIDNILPESFAPELESDKFYGSRVLCDNKKFNKIFEKVDSHEGLKTLFNNYPAESIQICRSILKLHSSFDEESKMVVKKLNELIDYNDDTLESYFGEHCSYRNKGKVTKFFDDLSVMDKDLLTKIVREQREKISELKEEISKLEEEVKQVKQERTNTNIILQISYLLSSLDERVDIKRYFFHFCINPMLTYEANLNNVKQMYHKYSRENHPDRARSEKERFILEDRMKILNEAYGILKDETSYKEYHEECVQRAWAIARAS